MPQKTKPKRPLRPTQSQRRQPGRESVMRPRPRSDRPDRPGSGKLDGKVALITGGDSGIGRAVAIAFAKEGADVVMVYLDEHDDAAETLSMVEQHGRRCIRIAGDIGREAFCRSAVKRTIRELGRLDVLVNNAGEQHLSPSVEDILEKQLERSFRTNVYSLFFMTKAALPHMKKGRAIVNTTSVTAYRGSAELLDYASTKGAIAAFTRSLSQAPADRKIRVNGVAPGPIWTPLIPSTFPRDQVKTFGSNVPTGRAGEPVEVAPSFVFLASEDAAYMSGQVLHPNGGEIVNG